MQFQLGLKYVLSFGGGLNSSALLVYLVKQCLPLDLVLFADTGNEFPYTYDNVKYYCEWAGENGIEFRIVKSKYDKDLYTYSYDKKIVPSRMTRDCTTKFKILPMRSYLRNRYGKQQKFIQYIGIAKEEAHRIRDSDVNYIQNSYPLIDAGIDREGCKTLLESYGLPIPEKSGCWFCPFTKNEEWLKLLDKNPDLFDRSMQLEENGKQYPTIVLHHCGTPLVKIKTRMDRANQYRLDDFEPSCDVAGSCFL